ncbi:TPA: hypothetical protein HA251_04155 [Candidatus Woesearchaeota archaeon]|nr:hypothetical protein [Candidatus Woesearchaeota archaeon]
MTSRNKKSSVVGMGKSGAGCVVCGWNRINTSGRSLLMGAHVRPFHESSDYDTANNIIALCPNHHAEFDAGLLTIHPDGKLVLHVDPLDEYHNKPLVGTVCHVQRGYLDYHFKRKFKG